MNRKGLPGQNLGPLFLIGIASFWVSLPTFAAPPTPPPFWREEGERARGLFHSLGESLEGTRRVEVEDATHNRFFLEPTGIIEAPEDPVPLPVPVAGESHLHFRLGESLLRKGKAEEALYIWKGLRAASLDRPDPDGVLHRMGERSTRRILLLKKKRSDFPELDRRTDPFLYYDDAGDRTVVISRLAEWRFSLPGLWDFRRGRLKEGGSLFFVVYLRKGAFQWVVSSDLFPHSLPGGLRDFRELWDQRRGWSGQRKRISGFRRRDLKEALCEEAGAGPSRYEGEPVCLVDELLIPSVNYRARELFALHPHRSLFLLLQRTGGKPNRGSRGSADRGAAPDAGAGAEEERLFDGLLRTLRFYGGPSG